MVLSLGFRVPNKVKILNWRAYNNMLLTMTNLFKKGIIGIA